MIKIQLSTVLNEIIYLDKINQPFPDIPTLAISLKKVIHL